jgi:antitoxin (DNA-binding transcriptional repressor) of toxin-antitoxin stability system
MEASIVDLRYRMKSVLEALDRGESVTVLHRGKPRARLEPIESAPKGKARMKVEDHPAFGMWKDRKDMEDVDAYLRHLRRPRYTRHGSRND